MSPPLRSFLAVVAGCLAAFFHIAAIQGVGLLIYPFPAGLDPARPETILAYLEVIPVGARLIDLLAWVVGTFAGSWVAARLAPNWRRAHGLLIGVLFTLPTLRTLTSIPHPAWFWALSLATVFPAACLGATLAGPVGEPGPSPTGPVDE
jgi:hypothetical protein